MLMKGLLQSLRRHMTVVNIAAGCFLLMTLVTAERYGFFGDELYYIACAKHLDFGYVDQPPLVPLLTLFSTWLFGETIISLRIMSGIAGALTVILSGGIAKDLGGGRLAQSLAALAICFASAFPALSSFISMNPIDIMLCTLFIFLFTKTIADPTPQRWIVLGVLSGIGLLNKYTFLVLGFSLLVSLVITKRWNVLRMPWMYIAGAMGFAIFLPHILWQIQHGWPTLEFMRNATEYKNLSLSPIAFFLQLTISLNPFTLPLWLGGLLYLFFGKEMKEYRFLGWMTLVFLLVYVLQNSKTYYVLPVFPLLLSVGAVALERICQAYRLRWLPWVTGSAIVLSGIVLMPLAVPILPVPQFVTYAKSMGLWNMIRMEKGEGDVLPIHFVYRMGWEELTKMVGTVYNGLPQDEMKQCAILGSWYGIAGAIDHFGPAYGLPQAICPRNSYWMWGSRNYSGRLCLQWDMMRNS